MSELRELYQETILDHNKRPRNFRKLAHANAHASGDNPLCGDRVDVYVQIEGDAIREVGFQGSGCAISTASASMLTECVKGKTLAEARALAVKFRGMLTGNGTAEGLGKLAVFSGVCEYPVRVKCATLAWHTLLAALEGKDEPVSTE